jgi:hypothetical protein
MVAARRKETLSPEHANQGNSPPASTSYPACVKLRKSSALAPTFVFLPKIHPSSLALEAGQLLRSEEQTVSPFSNDAMIQQDAADDTGHLADHAVSTNDGALDRRSFADLCGTSHHRIRRYLRFRVNESSVVRICWQSIIRSQQELHHNQSSFVSQNLERNVLVCWSPIKLLYCLPCRRIQYRA